MCYSRVWHLLKLTECYSHNVNEYCRYTSQHIFVILFYYVCEFSSLFLFFLRWIGLVGQFRPRKLISNIRKEVMSGDELDIPAFKDVVKHIADKSLYALGLFSHVSLMDDTSLLFNVERHGERKGRRSKATLFHRVNRHVPFKWMILLFVSSNNFSA